MDQIFADKTPEQLLGELLSRSDANTAVLVSRQGTELAAAGDTSTLNTTALAALVAGMFAATQEVAQMLGEEQFALMLQQGQQRHISISLIDEQEILIVVFDDLQRAGRVRHETRKYGQKLVQLRQREVHPDEEQGDISSAHFKEYALNLVDQIFSK